MRRNLTTNYAISASGQTVLGEMQAIPSAHSLTITLTKVIYLVIHVTKAEPPGRSEHIRGRHLCPSLPLSTETGGAKKLTCLHRSHGGRKSWGPGGQPEKGLISGNKMVHLVLTTVRPTLQETGAGSRTVHPGQATPGPELGGSAASCPLLLFLCVHI